jgi:hypothetical protein
VCPSPRNQPPPRPSRSHRPARSDASALRRQFLQLGHAPAAPLHLIPALPTDSRIRAGPTGYPTGLAHERNSERPAVGEWAGAGLCCRGGPSGGPGDNRLAARAVLGRLRFRIRLPINRGCCGVLPGPISACVMMPSRGWTPMEGERGSRPNQHGNDGLIRVIPPT